jgi:hypothetical protein
MFLRSVSAVAYTTFADWWSQQLVALFPNTWVILTWAIEGVIIGAHLSPLLSALCARRALSQRGDVSDIIKAIRADSVWKDVEGWQLLLFGPLIGGAAGAVYWALLYFPVSFLYGLLTST